MRHSARPWSVRLVLAGCLVGLAACGAPIDERARVAGVLQDDAPPPSSVVVREARDTSRAPRVTPTGPIAMTPAAPRPTETAPPPRRTPRATPTPAAPAVAPAPTEPEEVVTLVEPAELVGLGRSELADLMGTPDILRTEPPAEVWLYRNDACIAHIYLYEEDGPDDYQVNYVETRSRGAVVSSGQCLAHFAAGAASTVSLNETTN